VCGINSLAGLAGLFGELNASAVASFAFGVVGGLNFAREISSRVVFMIEGSIAIEAQPEQFFNAPSELRLESFLSKVL
jgi:ABC-type histidine transport system ATPase subunit